MESPSSTPADTEATDTMGATADTTAVSSDNIGVGGAHSEPVEGTLESAVATAKVCTCCWECKPLDQFTRQKAGKDGRLTECTEYRVTRNRLRNTEADRKELRTATREIRRSKFGRMRVIVDGLVNRFGGPTMLAERMHQYYKDGSESYRQRTIETLLSLEIAIAREAAAEKVLLAHKSKAGIADGGEMADTMGKLSDEQVLDATCESVRVLLDADLLPDVLRGLRKRKGLAGERLEAVRRAVT